MLHHLSFGTNDLARSAAFYDAVLSALGYARVWSSETEVGYGVPGTGDRFAVKQRPGAAVPGSGFHLAFAAADRGAVVRFYQAALQNGGRDNGPPGLHSQYGANYYAAFVFDPDGHAIEAVANGDPS